MPEWSSPTVLEPLNSTLLNIYMMHLHVLHLSEVGKVCCACGVHIQIFCAQTHLQKIARSTCTWGFELNARCLALHCIAVHWCTLKFAERMKHDDSIYACILHSIWCYVSLVRRSTFWISCIFSNFSLRFMLAVVLFSFHIFFSICLNRWKSE